MVAAVPKLSYSEFIDMAVASGFSPEEGAALAANAMSESALDPAAIEIGDVENRGVGLFQHTNNKYEPRRDMMVEAVPDWPENPAGQIGYFRQEMGSPGWQNSWQNVQEAGSVEDKAEAVMRHIERPKVQDDKEIAERRSHARQAYQQYIQAQQKTPNPPPTRPQRSGLGLGERVVKQANEVGRRFGLELQRGGNALPKNTSALDILRRILG